MIKIYNGRSQSDALELILNSKWLLTTMLRRSRFSEHLRAPEDSNVKVSSYAVFLLFIILLEATWAASFISVCVPFGAYRLNKFLIKTQPTCLRAAAHRDEGYQSLSSAHFSSVQWVEESSGSPHPPFSAAAHVWMVVRVWKIIQIKSSPNIRFKFGWSFNFLPPHRIDTRRLLRMHQLATSGRNTCLLGDCRRHFISTDSDFGIWL